MSENIFYETKVFKRPKSIRPPSDAVEYFVLSESKMDYIFFNKEQLLLMYHLIRFGYFDREIISNLYSSLAPKKALKSLWLQGCIGNRNFPISAYEERDGRKKIYYVNSKFAKWLFSVLPNHNDLYELSFVTEYDYSMFSIAANNLYGGKPRTVNIHDLNTRRFCARITKDISERCQHLSFLELNFQFSFPTNRQAVTALPDAAIFVKGKCYYVEYDRNTEAHFQLLGKIIAYFSEPYYEDSTVFFIFDSLGTPKGKDKNDFHPRVLRFLKNIQELKYNKSDNTYLENLKEKGVSILASPSQLSASQISYHICSSLNLIKDIDWKLTVERLSEIGGLPYDVLEIKSANDDGPFEYFVTVQNDSFEEEVLPLIRTSYIPAGFEKMLDELYREYKGQYNHVVIVFDKKINAQFYQLPYSPFFLSLFL